MPLSGVHLLLSYTCTHECDHCFLYCSPRAEGTFTLAEVEALLDQARALPDVTEIYFEGGEPFLFYPVLVAGLEAASARGFRTGVVTNCYWATSTEDARLWLAPLATSFIAVMETKGRQLARPAPESRSASIPSRSASRSRASSSPRKVRENLSWEGESC